MQSQQATNGPFPAPTQASLIRTLPLVTLHLTDRCNSRCVSCDYWRHGRTDITVESVARLLPSLQALRTTTVLVSGGEPLIHPQWFEIVSMLRQRQLTLWLVTSGVSLAKHAAKAAQSFQSVTVSLDGIDRQMYAAVRGLDAFDVVCAGIRELNRRGLAPGIRVTVQRANYRSLSAFVALAHELGAAQISFLAADVSNPHAFGRKAGFEADVALRRADLPLFENALNELVRERIADFESGYIAEKPVKLRKLLTYYSASCGHGAFPATRCNAPEFSAVIDTDGRVHPCFFIAGPNATDSGGLEQSLNTAAMCAMRNAIRNRERPECATCVCSLWRDPHELTMPQLNSLRALS